MTNEKILILFSVKFFLHQQNYLMYDSGARMLPLSASAYLSVNKANDSIPNSYIA